MCILVGVVFNVFNKVWFRCLFFKIDSMNFLFVIIFMMFNCDNILVIFIVFVVFFFGEG